MCTQGHHHGRGKKILFGILIIPLAAFLFGGAAMLLWNALVPGIFHLAPIGFWQALGLLVLARLLFGGFHGGHARRGPRRHVDWAGMSEEERAKFREAWERRCGGIASASAPPAP